MHESTPSVLIFSVHKKSLLTFSIYQNPFQFQNAKRESLSLHDSYWLLSIFIYVMWIRIKIIPNSSGWIARVITPFSVKRFPVCAEGKSAFVYDYNLQSDGSKIIMGSMMGNWKWKKMKNEKTERGKVHWIDVWKFFVLVFRLQDHTNATGRAEKLITYHEYWISSI